MTRKKGIFTLIIYFWGSPILATLIISILGLSKEVTEGFFFFSVLMVMLGAILVGFNWNLVKEQFKENLTKKETYKYGLIGAVVLICAQLASVMSFQALVPGLSLTPGNEAELNVMFENVPKLAIILVTGLIVPFVEELVFRPGIMGIITRDKVKDSYLPYILCALVFTFLHDTSILTAPSLQTLYFFSIYFVPSLVLSIFYKLSNHNLIAVYLIHVANNVLGSL